MIQTAILFGISLPMTVSAQLRIDTGVYSTTETILGGIIDVLLLWSGVVTTAVFLIGALMMVASGGSDTYLSAGKKIMKAAAIGLAIILASWMILSTVVFVIS
jgi:ABC-type nickel/cobalt efflux system permease component RcnA